MSAVAMTPELRLPWESSIEEDRRFRRILGAALGVLLVLAICVPLLPLSELSRQQREVVPPHLARVILERQALPKAEPVPEKPRPRPVQEKKPEKPKPVEQPRDKPKPEPKAAEKPRDTLAEARKSAAVAGVLAFQDDLREMRDSVDVEALDQTRTSRGVASAAKVERAIITSGTRADSGGIQTPALSRDTGGPALSAREATSVQSTIASKGKRQTAQSRSAQLGGRSDESIRRIMDSNKGAIFAIYNRALRANPLLEGKLVFEMVIDATGAIEELKLLSSELEDEELTRKILSRIRLISFGAEQVVTTRVNYSFDFLPYT